jgi:putative endopeptidase
MCAHQFEFNRAIKKLKKPTDRKEWHVSPPIVNAFYNPNLNEIVFPAGILQPPFFYPLADDAINYGAIGTAIGHEITHGFDDQGSQFDEKGNLENWWTAADKKRYQMKSRRLVQQFNKFEVIDSMHINGKLTLGENIADLGGIVIAYSALQKELKGKQNRKIGGFTPEQRFFISVAVSDRVLARPEFLKMQIRNDPHSPDKYRTNAPLSNMSEFYETFGVKRGDSMYRPEKERVMIW